MPSWKKVILSGSNAALNSLTVSNGITGSLFGTASFASTASFLGSTTNAFIQNGNSFGTTALLGTNDNQSLAFETSGSTRMFISSSGNVGIGTTSSLSRFHITSPTDTGYPTLGSQKGSFFLAGDTNLYGLMAGIDASSGTFWMQAMRNNTATAYNILLNPVGGNVGIGTTTPNAKLDVNGNTIITGSLTVTNGITGSLFGTASWAVSASYAPSSATFPYTGSALITGSLGITGSLSTTGSDASLNGVAVGRGGGNISSNTTVGQSSLISNTTGTNNVSIGTSTLFLNTTGANNVAIGSSGLGSNISGGSNTAIGQGSLQSSTDSSNTAIGQASLSSITSGANNIAFGRFAGRYIADKTTLLTSINNSLLIGYQASPLGQAQTNQIVIGYDATGLGSNTTVIGNSSTTATAIYGDLLLGSTTDNGTDKLQVTGTTKLNGNTTVTGSLNVSGSITGSLFGTSSWAVSASWAPATTTAATASFVTSSNVFGPNGSNSILSASFAISSSNAATASWATNVTNNGVTSVSASGTVSGITLGGGTITSTGTLTLSGTVSGLTNSNLSGTAGITNANLATPSLMIGTTNIALGATGSTLAGLTTVSSTAFSGSFSGSHFGPLTGNASTATSASISTNLSGGYVIATSIYGTSINIAGNGASADPYGTIALTQPANSTNYSYYGLTRAGNLGAGFGLTGTTGALGLGANAYWFGTATAGLAGTMGTAWLAFNGTSLIAVGTISGSSFTGAGTGLTGTASSLSIGGNAATATTATNVVGATNRVLFNNSTNTTTTDSNLTWDGTTFNVGGTLTATVKSFIIDHPTKKGKKLQYGVLEGPEHSVYVRGRLTNENTIVLPDHWHGLVHEDTITVNLTSIGKKQDLWVEQVNAHKIKIGSENEINCFYTVFAERKDIEKLVTEFDK